MIYLSHDLQSRLLDQLYRLADKKEFEARIAHMRCIEDAHKRDAYLLTSISVLMENQQS